ncbi:NAD(P)-binding domain protein [Ascosphaera apis ARSEF 7405]|uniref:NAD(P)-binding domain protein n=1 Tax=Ascosphaera apis ARSEF 7405 TaxID=392613 RepID=A0A168AK19_9EURO|nr:NAD(P)-binding domain protein [Ascosphaera apis ARSEF 7405]
MAPGVLSMFSLEGKTAIVTGGTRGIGAGMALGLAEAGADIVLVQRDESNTKTRDAIRALGRRADIYVAELTDREAVKKIIPEITKDTTRDFQILINCAGIQRRYPAEEFPDHEWDEVIHVNLSVVFTLSRDFAAYLLSKPAPTTGRRGSIISIGSLMTFQGGKTVPAYSAAKGGVGQLTKAFANEWTAKGITATSPKIKFVRSGGRSLPPPVAPQRSHGPCNRPQMAAAPRPPPPDIP